MIFPSWHVCFLLPGQAFHVMSHAMDMSAAITQPRLLLAKYSLEELALAS